MPVTREMVILYVSKYIHLFTVGSIVYKHYTHYIKNMMHVYIYKMHKIITDERETLRFCLDFSVMGFFGLIMYWKLGR